MWRQVCLKNYIFPPSFAVCNTMIKPEAARGTGSELNFPEAIIKAVLLQYYLV